MYRLLLSENPEQFLPKQLPAPIVRRTYRWGTMWGILENGAWRAEQRTQIQTDPYVLEEVVNYASCHAPPPSVDDVWEEEIVRVGDLEYNGSFVTVCLPGTILKQWCLQNKLPVPAIPDSMPEIPKKVSVPTPTPAPARPMHSQSQSHPHSQKPHDKNRNTQFSRPFKPKCFIED